MRLCGHRRLGRSSTNMVMSWALSRQPLASNGMPTVAFLAHVDTAPDFSGKQRKADRPPGLLG